MKIRIRDVVKGGIRVVHEARAEDIGLAGESFIDPGALIRVEARLEKVNDFILVRAIVMYASQDHCARCLAPLARPVTLESEIDLEIHPGDEWLDLGERVREEMLVANLPRVLCRDDCQGICPDCGADLNTEQCACARPSPAPQKTKGSH